MNCRICVFNCKLFVMETNAPNTKDLFDGFTKAKAPEGFTATVTARVQAAPFSDLWIMYLGKALIILGFVVLLSMALANTDDAKWLNHFRFSLAYLPEMHLKTEWVWALSLSIGLLWFFILLERSLQLWQHRNLKKT